MKIVPCVGWIVAQSLLFLSLSSLSAEDVLARQIVQRNLQFYLDNGKEILHGTYIESAGERLISKGNYVDGQKIGVWENYHASGLPASEIFYKAGLEEGLSRSWWPSGNLQSKVSYVAGKKIGPEEQWFDNGQRQHYMLWENGLQNGPMQKWHMNGKEQLRCLYLAGKKDGLLQEWDTEGALLREELYQSDILIKLLRAKEKYNDGSPKESYEYYLDDKTKEVRHGPYKKWFPNGEIWIECNYVHGQLDGLWQYGKLDGLECRQENYKQGIKDGVFQWFHNSKVIREEIWKDGVLVSQKRH